MKNSVYQGEQAHRTVKRLYGLTNKRNVMHQIGAKYTRQQVFRKAEQQEIHDAHKPEDVEKHHIVSHTKNNSINIYSFVRENLSDPAKKVRLSRCAKSH